MKYCSICLQPNTRPNSYFTNEGICPANYHNALKTLIGKRFSQLEKSIKKYPRKKGQFFDCIIGVSGGKDSTR